MEELNFYVKKLQDLEYRGEWKEHYRHSYEKIVDYIDRSQFFRRGFYLKELEKFNYKFMDMPYIANDEDKLQFRKMQKSIIDMVYQVMNENKKIFLVHSPDAAMANKVSSFLGRLKLDFDMVDEEGQPDIKKFTKKAKNSDFAIVLLSADELVYPENSPGRWRPAQNVLLELGYFHSHVGKKNIVIFHVQGKDIEIPYNFEGLTYHPFDMGGGWKNTLITELRKAGIYLDQEVVRKAL
jgi:predicted nucleotide-binding protein